MTNAGLRALPAEGAILTESPVWFDETRTLAWVDMVSGTISTASDLGRAFPHSDRPHRSDRADAVKVASRL